ncbi:MAG TPA: hypothetical protein PLK90_06820 [Clostridiales bacterium]|nr:hypothetical protein [Clostridiales bacterium]HQP70095.1 hypothetical protein [Clostridiales bacterium]
MDKEKKPVYLFVVNTLKDEPRKFYLAVLTVFVVNIFIYYMFSPTFGMISVILTILSLTEIFFPFKYALYENGIIVDRFFYKVKHEYSYYKKVLNDKNGIFLSPFRYETRLESFRGILLRIPKDKRTEVMVFLKAKIEAPLKSDSET